MAMTSETVTDYERKRLNDAWRIAERAGVQQIIRQLLDTVAEYERVVGEEQTAREAVRVAEEAHAGAVANTEWLLDGRFETAGNKTYLVTDEDELAPVEHEDGVHMEPTGRKVRRAMTADERTAWKRREAGRDPEVAETARHLAAAESRLAEIRAQITIANTRISALKHALDGSVAVLQALTAAIHPFASLTANSTPEGGIR